MSEDERIRRLRLEYFPPRRFGDTTPSADRTKEYADALLGGAEKAPLQRRRDLLKLVLETNPSTARPEAGYHKSSTAIWLFANNNDANALLHIFERAPHPHLAGEAGTTLLKLAPEQNNEKFHKILHQRLKQTPEGNFPIFASVALQISKKPTDTLAKIIDDLLRVKNTAKYHNYGYHMNLAIGNAIEVKGTHNYGLAQAILSNKKFCEHLVDCVENLPAQTFAARFAKDNAFLRQLTDLAFSRTKLKKYTHGGYYYLHYDKIALAALWHIATGLRGIQTSQGNLRELKNAASALKFIEKKLGDKLREPPIPEWGTPRFGSKIVHYKN